jgi:hypothetical protein
MVYPEQFLFSVLSLDLEKCRLSNHRLQASKACNFYILALLKGLFHKQSFEKSMSKWIGSVPSRAGVRTLLAGVKDPISKKKACQKILFTTSFGAKLPTWTAPLAPCMLILLPCWDPRNFLQDFVK